MKNDKYSRNRKITTTRSNKKDILNKNRSLTSPPLKKLGKEQYKAIADENGSTPPPGSIIMKRSAMRAISPLTTKKLSRKTVVQKDVSSEESSRDDSFASGDDDETRHQTLSSAEEKSKSRSLDSFVDSYEDSQSSSEFEFGGDDEEFVPEEDDEDDESAAMSEFIVDDLSEENHYRNFSNNSSDEKKGGINNHDDEDVLTNDDSAKSDSDNDNNTSNNEDVDSEIEEDEFAGTGCAGSECASFAFGDHQTTADDGDDDDDDDDDGGGGDDENDDDENENDNTPTKVGLPRKTLDFDSPEPQMAMIVDEDEDFDDNDDVLFATIIDIDSVDGDTIVLTFDEDEDIDAKNNEAFCVRGTIKDTTPTKENSDGKTRQRSSPFSSSIEQQSNNIEEKSKQINSPEKLDLMPPVSSKKNGKKLRHKKYRQEGEVKRGKWALGAKIGVGSFGTVHVGMNKKSGVLMAIKKFKMEGAIMKDIRTEVELMRSLKHTNIVRYLGAQMDDQFLHIFQEWVPGGSVASLLSKFGSFSIEVIQSYISQALNGLSYLHDNDIMHRDIKGSNILVNDDGVVKLADFGASKKLKNLAANMMMSLTVRGTPYFMAPEVFEEKYSAKADIWGIGCVAFQMVTTTPPWRDLGFTNPISLFNHIKKNKGSPPMVHPEKESMSKREQSSWIMLQEFVNRCFEQDPSERPSVKELFEDPFILRKSEIHNDDDESTNYHGLFSPGNESKTLFSPKQLSLSAKRRSSQTEYHDERELTALSPSRPKKNGNSETLLKKVETPNYKSKTQNSPSRDTREWPTWAKSQLEKENNSEQKDLSEKREMSNENISELMDSLALSEDSGDINQKLLINRRSSTTSGSTVNSNLVGLKFLESTRSNLSK